MENANKCITDELVDQSLKKHDFLEISCNWKINNDKHFTDAITTIPLSQASNRITLDEIVSLDTCISVQSQEYETEPCMLDIRTTNCQRIARIAVVSEASVLEFFKQFGEYETTIFAELVDDFEGSSVCSAETTISPPSTEASIKFTKMRNNRPYMWIFGITLILTEPVNETKMDLFDYDIIKNFILNSNTSFYKEENIVEKILESYKKKETHLTNNEDSCPKDFMPFTLNALRSMKNKNEGVTEDSKTGSSNYNSDFNNSESTDIKSYIDNKFDNLEKRLIEKINEMEWRTNQKLDAILEKLETKKVNGSL